MNINSYHTIYINHTIWIIWQSIFQSLPITHNPVSPITAISASSNARIPSSPNATSDATACQRQYQKL